MPVKALLACPVSAHFFQNLTFSFGFFRTGFGWYPVCLPVYDFPPWCGFKRNIARRRRCQGSIGAHSPVHIPRQTRLHLLPCGWFHMGTIRTPALQVSGGSSPVKSFQCNVGIECYRAPPPNFRKAKSPTGVTRVGDAGDRACVALLWRGRDISSHSHRCFLHFCLNAFFWQTP